MLVCSIWTHTTVKWVVPCPSLANSDHGRFPMSFSFSFERSHVFSVCFECYLCFVHSLSGAEINQSINQSIMYIIIILLHMSCTCRSWYQWRIWYEGLSCTTEQKESSGSNWIDQWPHMHLLATLPVWVRLQVGRRIVWCSLKGKCNIKYCMCTHRDSFTESAV